MAGSVDGSGPGSVIDVMRNGGQPRFPALTEPAVIAHYAKENNEPWYGPKAKAGATGKAQE